MRERGFRLWARVMRLCLPAGPNVEYVKNERGLITRTERDSYRNVLSVEHPDGTTETWKYLPTQSFVTEHTDQAGVVSKYKYTPRGQIFETREAVGTPVERLTTYGYDQYGQLERVTRRHSLTVLDPLKDATSRYMYDNFGNVTQATDPENNVVKMSAHDVMGNTLTMIDARNKTRRMEYSKQGWQEKSISALGFISESKYNLDGDRKKSISPIDGTRTATTEYFYDDDGRLERTLDPLGGESSQHYDDEGRMDESTDARLVKTQMRYDGRGRMEKIIDGNLNEIETIYGDVTNALEGLVSGRKYPTYEETYKCDQMDRQVETKQVLSATLSYISSMTYDAVGQVESQTDAKGRTSLRFYDALRRLTKEIDPILGETIYTYDERDNLRTVTDANGNTHTFTYDRLNRKLTEARPMGQTIGYEYDPNGNLRERTSPNGAKREFRYDDDNRLELEEHFLPNTMVASKTVSYTYDQRGLLKTYDDGLTSGLYVYNDKGEKTSESITFGRGAAAFTKTIGRTYEDNGLLKTMTYPGTTGTLNFTYDDNNQLKTYKIPGLAANNDTLTYQYRWNAIREITMPGNLRRIVTLDALQRPERIEVRGYGATPGNNGQPVMDHRYIYDEVSNIKKKTTLDGEYIYDYDHLDRLTGATPPLSLRQSASNPNGLPDEKYTYDGVHNRMSSQHQPGVWVYNDNNELKSWGLGAEQKTIDYDLNGSTVKEETGTPVTATREYVYDAQDRLVEVKDNSATIAKYAYDLVGRRIWREASGQTTWFLYSDEGLLGEYVSMNNAFRIYGWQPEKAPNPNLIWLTEAGATELPIIVENKEFAAIYDVALRNSENILQTAFGSHEKSFPIRNPGQWADSVSGIYQNWYRDFNPQIGRYLEIDPIGLKDGLNQYGYAYQNPIRFFDINGKAVFPICDGGAINGTVRCDGRGGFWLVNCDSHACTKHCTKAHEQSHINDFVRDMPSSCKGVPAGGLPNFLETPVGKDEWHARSECRASIVGHRCAWETLKAFEDFPQWFRSWCNENDCRKAIFKRLELEEKLLEYYSCSTRGF